MDGGAVRWVRRLVSRAWFGVFLIFLVFPVMRLAAHPPSVPVAALTAAGLGLFVVLYWRVMAAGLRNPGRVPTGDLVALVAVSAMLLVPLGPSWLVACGYYLTVCLVFATCGWRSATALGLLVAGELVAGRLLGITVLRLSAVVAQTGAFTVGMLALRRYVQTIEQLRQARAQVARLAVADERARLGRDLHDLLGHSLSAIAVTSELAAKLAHTDPDRTAGQVRDIERIARQALSDMRAVVTGYHDLSLAAELDRAGHTLRTGGIACTVQPADRPLPAPVESVFAWVVREATTNVLRHSHATCCRIILGSDGHTATIEVTDNGIATTTTGNQSGHGLAGLTQRIANAGGQLQLVPNDGGGLRVRAELPHHTNDRGRP